MDITNYTSYDEIRSTVGLSAKELPDTELALEIYGNALYLAMSEVTLPTEAPGPGPLYMRYIEIRDLAESSRTTAEQKLYVMTRMYCTYVVANEVAISLSMKAPKTITDSKAALSRFSPESTFLELQKKLAAMVASLKTRIEEINETSVSSIALMGVASPDTDVVTDE